MKKCSYLFVLVISILGCKNNKPEAIAKPAMDTTIVVKKDFTHIKFSKTQYPVFGMMLKLGITDSLLHQGKIIAFCNKGCKDEFVKNPKGYEVK